MKPLFAFLLLASTALAQCTGPNCPQGGYQTQPEWAAPLVPRVNAVEPSGDVPRAVVRVWSIRGDHRWGASGVVCDADGKTAKVLTAWHTFAESGNAPPQVVLSDGRRYDATLIHHDAEADLALLLIADPGVKPYPICDAEPVPGQILYACGFGENWTSQLKTVAGTFRGYEIEKGVSGVPLVAMDGSTRQGDSGGPILTKDGCCMGIVKGGGNGKVNGPCLPRLRRTIRWLVFGTVRPPATPTVIVPPIVVPPVVLPPAPPTQPPVVPPVAPPTVDEVAALRARVEALEAKLAALTPIPGPAGPQGPPGKDGKDGASVTIDYPTIIANLPPLYIGAKRPDGSIFSAAQPVKMGDTIYINTTTAPMVRGPASAMTISATK